MTPIPTTMSVGGNHTKRQARASSDDRGRDVLAVVLLSVVMPCYLMSSGECSSVTSGGGSRYPRGASPWSDGSVPEALLVGGHLLVRLVVCADRLGGSVVRLVR